MRGRVAVVVALVLLTAGCSAVQLGSGTPEPRAETLTPVPVTPAGTPVGAAVSPKALPPGVEPNGTVDLTRLLIAHEYALTERSYTWVYERTSSQQRSSIATVETRRVLSDDGALLVSDSSTAGGPNETRYLTDDGGYLRLEYEDGTVVASLDQPRSDHAYVPLDRLLWQYLDDRTFRYDRVTVDGRPYVRLYHHSDGSQVTAYVSPGGFVRAVDVSYVTTASGGDLERVRVRFDYTRVGETNVTRPAWARSTNATATVTPGDGPPNETATG